MKQGDFTGLGKQYSKNRPDYNKTVLKALINLLEKPIENVDFVDVGAGTGIWTRMVCSLRPKTAIAIEPIKDMMENGINDSKNFPIKWIQAYAESTGLQDNSVDWLTMASSFHWTNFEKAVLEFSRLLRRGGRFTALWNPRLIEVNPILVDIEKYLNTLKPNIKRVSSGRSGITETLTQDLWDTELFEDVIYMEGRHVISMSHERYLGAWRSVNDLQAQLGEEKFNEFIVYIEKKIKKTDFIEATYLTRAWSAQKKDINKSKNNI